MDIHDLKRKVQAARRFTVALTGADGAARSVTLQRPSRYELQMAVAQSGLDAERRPAAQLQWDRLVLTGAVVDWAGVLASDMGAPDAEAVPYDAAAVPLLLDAQPDWADQLATALWAAMAKAEHVEGTAEKN